MGNNITNGEWLRSLSDYELSDLLSNQCSMCIINVDICDENEHCSENILEWLKRNHGDEKLLKPCPFCGGEAEIKDSGIIKGTHYYEIGCKNYDCYAYIGKSVYSSKEEALYAWNNRSK